MVRNLAIVIPVFKIFFFEQVLESLKNQTNKNFNVYIGNDGSLENFEEIINKYTDSLHITYQYFENNLGKDDLVAHWERCIDIVNGEEWIWLFSDDDVMDKFCVEMFYQTLNDYPKSDLFHFNVQKINEQNQFVGISTNFPRNLIIEDFITERIRNGLDSFVVEYIFRKSSFFELNRFCKFDLAWASDDALWIKLGNKNGIITIAGAKVYWRISQYNISPNTIDKTIIIRKLFAQISFAEWLLKFAKDNNVQIENEKLKSFLLENNYRWLKYYINKLSCYRINDLLNQYCKVFNMQNVFFYKMYILLYKMYQSIIK
jgi:hypothetical protein